MTTVLFYQLTMVSTSQNGTMADRGMSLESDRRAD